MIKRPLLAGTVKDMDAIKYPVMASAKLDGIRCLVLDGKALTRSFKPIPNNHIRQTIEGMFQHDVDGEIIVEGKTFNEVQSAVMTVEGEPWFRYLVFDMPARQEASFRQRYDYLCSLYSRHTLHHVVIDDKEALLKYEETVLKSGAEGVMIRSPEGKYKEGRSTVKEGILLKIKRFKDAEAVVVDVIEEQSNTNAKEKDAFGLAKRSTKKEGKVGKGVMGSLLVEYKGEQFGIGTGFTGATRYYIWNNRKHFIGKLVKFKYQEMGVKAPRFPVFIEFRDTRDL